ncbi:MAG: cytochrome c/FTR1 family iron permease [Caulobacter sp.]|nr:cytochrome c/FTR1 family iron permease [Caulobacter sp.]
MGSWRRRRIFIPAGVVAGLCLALLVVFGGSGAARAAVTPAETVWRLLDYVAVDYPGAVEDGKIISTAEYAEMVEFAETASAQIAALPATPAKPGLIKQAAALKAAIGAKRPPSEVAGLARGLAGDLLAAYPVALAPSAAPDFARGAAVYAENCASCHGAAGDGKGPASKGLDPPPIAFTDQDRARHRSVFGLYQVIEQGLDGTAMPSFSHLPQNERWALAFYVGSLSQDDGARSRGEALWKGDANLRGQFPNLATLTKMTPADLAKVVGDKKADDVMAYLRRSPGVLTEQREASLVFARGKLKATVDAYASGNKADASSLALSTYLDGIEPFEPAIAARNPKLLSRIEAAMGEFRSRIGSGAPVDSVRQQAAVIEGLLDEADAVLAPAAADTTAAFVGALTILLREGLEALLIVVAMIAFLKKADREDVLPYVHGGWAAALGAGVLTWAAATFFITISGAQRELTEGFGGLFAAAVLLSVGIWMHGKSQADAWQRYIKERLSKALSRGSAWFLFLLAFVVVYREVFETILFFAALWSKETAGAVLAGAGTAVVALAAIAWAMLRYSTRLPISKFFAASAALVAVLAFVLAGKGLAALQEAGIVPVTPVSWAPKIELLGFYPTWQTILLQLAVVAILVAGYLYNRSPRRGEGAA